MGKDSPDTENVTKGDKTLFGNSKGNEILTSIPLDDNKIKANDEFVEIKIDSQYQSVTIDDLKKLMESRGEESIKKINENYGGIEGLCKILKTDPTKGLPNIPENIQKRKNKYGSNTLPAAHSKSFLSLLFNACKDPTLVILIISGFISLLLSFYDPAASEGSPNNVTISSPLASIPQVILNDTHLYNTTTNGTNLIDVNPLSNNSTKDEKETSEEHNTAWIEGAAILICVIVVVLVTALNDYSKERQFKALQAQVETGHTFSVIRDEKEQNIPVSDLVVGDLCRVKYGDLIPADGILVQASDLKVDESSLTGESDHVKKGLDCDVALFSGTYVMEGSGLMVVTAVGINSQSGIIMALLNSGHKPANSLSTSTSSSNSSSSSSSGESDDDKSSSYISKNKILRYKKRRRHNSSSSNISTTSSTSSSSTSSTSSKSSVSNQLSKSILQAKLSKLAIQIISCGTGMAILALVILVVRYSIEHYVIEQKAFDITDIHQFVRFFIIGVTILVISIPEGLPLAIALALTYSVRKMMKDNNLVRHLDACETMGNATTICSDKTGTLTTNRMTVVQSFINDNYFTSQDSQPTSSDIGMTTRKKLAQAISINSAYNSMIEAPTKLGEAPKQLGNKTECALLGFLNHIGENYSHVRKIYPEKEHVKVYTFNSSRKCMMTIIHLYEDGNIIGYRVFVKGASEIILAKCKYIMNGSGEPITFTKEQYEHINEEVIENMAENGLRTICVGYKDYVLSSAREVKFNEIAIEKLEDIDVNNEEEINKDFNCLGIFGIQDPVRPEVPPAIETCQQAGITVRMVTGDNINTARAIAMQCGIVKPDDDYLIMEGKEFNDKIRDEMGNVDQEKFDEIWPRLRVLARAQPADKFTLVKGIIESKNSANREIVAVTGDGTNDGPALKKADVGFAMGIAGTDVAKAASDIILTDDNFTSLVKAVMWGRNVYDSISKFLQFQLTVNIVAILTAFFSALFISDSPLKAVHMLWINLIMDTLASLALATEMPTKELLRRKPYGRKKSLISRTMIRNIACHAIYQLIVLFFLLFKGTELLYVDSGLDAPLHAPPSKHFTIIFNTFVMMTLFNEINSRKVHGERNVFKHILDNSMFCVIWISTFICQILIVQFGGAWFQTSPLDVNQWSVCLILGVSVLPLGQLIAFLPSKKLPKSIAVGREVPELTKSQPGGICGWGGGILQPSGVGGLQKGVEMFGIHNRVVNGLLCERSTLPEPAPMQQAQVVKQWRRSLRHHQHKRLTQKRLRTVRKSIDNHFDFASMQSADKADKAKKSHVSKLMKAQNFHRAISLDARSPRDEEEIESPATSPPIRQDKEETKEQ
uniref:Calcium-transporting ATPase n=1 Tax=Strongyloides papillosus TaxID=174720 RepID=A0A0N5CHT3_STREA